MEASGVVFLDCDGVLCNARSQLCDFDKNDDTLVHHPDIPPLEKRCIAALQRIVLETDASIVLTSTWRLLPENRRFLTEALEAAGCRVVGDTPALGSRGRGAEVAAWLQGHPQVTHFVVIEDDDRHVASFAEELPPGTWIQTTMRNEADPLSEGITDEIASAAVNILKSREAEELRKRKKFDPTTGGFLRFPGVTVVCDITGSDVGALSRLPEVIRAQALLGRCFSPLPPPSYHATVLDIHCQYALGLNDKAHAELLRGPQWAAAARDIVAADFRPKFRPKPGGLLVTASVIGMELVPCGDDTPAHPRDLPLGQKLASDLGVQRPHRHPWHFTLAYCHRPSEFQAADASVVEAESAALEAAVAAAVPDGAALPMGPARLCRFEDMTAFVPWDGSMPAGEQEE